jgi:DHA2 family multidrug resistance protein
VSARSYRREWVGFTTMSAGLFMAILDIQIVAAALPRIATSLHTPLSELSWVQTAYLVTEVIAIALSGRLARAMSTRWLFGLATLAFALTSLGCGLSHDFVTLIVWRTIQGFAAGLITPTVFAVGYKMFPKKLQHRAMLVAGASAMVAPSIGPFLGGFIAEKFSWNWLFFINVPIGIAIAVIVLAVVRVDVAHRASWRTNDVPSFLFLAVGLAALQIMLKVAPEDHWKALRDYGLIVATLGCAFFAVKRCVEHHDPLVNLLPLRSAGFATASAFNFVLGLGLYGSLYVLPLFLGFVRFHTPLEIGITMTVMGVAQLIAAPFASIADQRLPARYVVFAGFALFSAGAFANAFQTPLTDSAQLVWPQILRGAALLLCILPITNVALDELPAQALSNASGLLNFMRNLGGAIGIGLVDTIINLRPETIGKHLLVQLSQGNAKTAAFVGVPVGLIKGMDLSHTDPADISFVKPIVERAAATIAFNEAWLLIGGIMLASLLMLPLLRRPSTIAQRSLQRAPERFAHETSPVAP